MEYTITLDGKPFRDVLRCVLFGGVRGGDVVHQASGPSVTLERVPGRTRSDGGASDQVAFGLFAGPKGLGEAQYVAVKIVAKDPNTGDTIYELEGTGAVESWQITTGEQGVVERVVLRLSKGSYKDKTGKAGGAFDVHAARGSDAK